MKLDEAQESGVRRWVEQGCGLSEIQQKLSKEFNLSATYMDVRFLIIDLGLKVQEKRRSSSSSTAPTATTRDLRGEEDESPGEGPPDRMSGGVPLQVDRITKAGSLASGKVIFSDGIAATWMVDQSGRLAISPEKRGYSPNHKDLQTFQIELRKALETRAF